MFYNRTNDKKDNVFMFPHISLHNPFSSRIRIADESSMDSLSNSYKERDATSECSCATSKSRISDACKQQDLQGPWVQRTWNVIARVLPKQVSANRVAENEIHQIAETLSDSNKSLQPFEHLPSFERHILLFMKQKPGLHETSSVACEEDLKCKSCVTKPVAKYPDLSCFWLGIFYNPKAKSNFAPIIMSGESTMPISRHKTSGFARLRGEPEMIHPTPSPHVDSGTAKTPEVPTKPAFGVLQTMSLTSIKELIPSVATPPQNDFPNKEMLSSVQDFFRYTEYEGRRMFEQLDLDSDGQVTLDDIKKALGNMNLPTYFAKKFRQRNCKLWPKKSFGWSEFSSIIQEKEPIMVKLFNSVGVSKSGTLQRAHIKESLIRANLPATESNVTAMMRFLGADANGSIKYGQFRKFMVLIPTEQLRSGPWSVWLRAATSDVRSSSTILNQALSLAKKLSCGLDEVKPYFTAKDWSISDSDEMYQRVPEKC